MDRTQWYSELQQNIGKTTTYSRCNGHAIVHDMLNRIDRAQEAKVANSKQAITVIVSN
jgi:hypothetical protein